MHLLFFYFISINVRANFYQPAWNINCIQEVFQFHFIESEIRYATSDVKDKRQMCVVKCLAYSECMGSNFQYSSLRNLVMQNSNQTG